MHLAPGCCVAQAAFTAAACSTTTIQPMPNLSATMPKHGEKKVLISGWCTWPPSDKRREQAAASASSLALSVSEKPLNSVAVPSHHAIRRHDRGVADPERTNA